MHLQKIEIQGFKSFAAKTILTFPEPENFNRGVTAIVGPNGSGKSNISDAIRWVLGEQSMKSIRGKRSEDVIFFGSTLRSAVGMSEVSLFFNNEDQGFPLEYSEVVLTRRLYRSGESEYLINKNKVRLSDLTLLLAQAHIGQRSYCIVSQGMIDAILVATPAERKGYFDDAAGIREYQLKRDAALLKLNATEENLAQSTLHIKEIEPKIRFFERQIKRREQRAEVEKEYNGLIRAYYASLWNEYEGKSDQLRVSYKRLSDLRAACERTAHALQKELSVYQQSQHRQGKLGVSDLSGELDALLLQKNTIHAALAVVQSKASKQGGNVADAFLSLRLNEVLEDLHRIEAKQALLQKEITGLADEEIRAADEISRYDGKNSATPHASLESVRNDLESIASLEDQTSEHESYETLHSFLARIFARLRSIIETIRSSSVPHGIQKKRDSLLARLYEVRARKERIEQELAIVLVERDQKKESARSLNASNANPGDQAEAYEKELQTLDRKIQSIRSQLYSEYTQGEETKESLIQLQKDLQERHSELSSLQSKEHEARVELAKIEAKQEELYNTIFDEFRIGPDEHEMYMADRTKLHALFGTSKVLAHRDEAKREIEKLKRTLESIGSVDEEALNEYETIHQRYQFLTRQVSDLEETIKKLEQSTTELDQIMEERFTKSMKKINEKFQEYFSSLFNGGNARIVILNAPKKTTEQEEDEDAQGQEDVVSGIDIEASPPGKKLKSISLLSGGERALTAIALLCAILATNPSPFVVLDEVDAALDESNALRFTMILSDLARKTQFIVITHSRVTIHTGQILYGVTMSDDGVSHVVSLDVKHASGTIAQS
ncbi:AAA family ATPase [Candidatus Uhrbacteria bacterium]|nr:AAA family ATPase [Candidatus Uhrbacteria bacterium]